MKNTTAILIFLITLWADSKILNIAHYPIDGILILFAYIIGLFSILITLLFNNKKNKQPIIAWKQAIPTFLIGSLAGMFLIYFIRCLFMELNIELTEISLISLLFLTWLPFAEIIYWISKDKQN